MIIQMRLLLASSHGKLVERMGKQLACAGVPCEVRYRPPCDRYDPAYQELWVQADTELHWATMLLAMHAEVGRN
jgi:hypothetical protein